jgi:acyl carrier protein
MNNDATLEKVTQIISQTMGVPVNRLDGDSSPETVDVWDSLMHMNLVLALEEEFGVQFSDEQIMQMLDVKLITATLRELL